MIFRTYKLRNYNFRLIFLVLLISTLGVVAINSANSSYTNKQIIGVIGAFIIMIAVSLIDYNWIGKYWYLLYGINALVLVAVKLFGHASHGARRWFLVPGVGTVQPSEFSKCVMIVCAAMFLEQNKEHINTVKTLLAYMVLCGVPVLLIAIETDLSTSIDLALILLAIVFVAGLSYKLIGGALAVAVPFIVAVLVYADHAANPILLKDYQVDRIKAFLHPDKYTQSAGLQQRNSVMAIGSGMLHGKGLNTSSMATVKDANLVSEQQTDFIFSVVGEETGFIGCLVIIGILFLIVLECFHVARRARNTSGMLICTGVGSLIAFQTFINIGVATKLLPNTGLPLPFVSYGLSSLLSLMLSMGLVLNVGLQRRQY